MPPGGPPSPVHSLSVPLVTPRLPGTPSDSCTSRSPPCFGVTWSAPGGSPQPWAHPECPDVTPPSLPGIPPSSPQVRTTPLGAAALQGWPGQCRALLSPQGPPSDPPTPQVRTTRSGSRCTCTPGPGSRGRTCGHSPTATCTRSCARTCSRCWTCTPSSPTASGAPSRSPSTYAT